MSRKPNTLELEKLQAIIVDALEDVKAQAITVIDTSKISDEFDRVVIATATSNRQTRALASNVQIKVKENGLVRFGQRDKFVAHPLSIITSVMVLGREDFKSFKF